MYIYINVLCVIFSLNFVFAQHASNLRQLEPEIIANKSLLYFTLETLKIYVIVYGIVLK